MSSLRILITGSEGLVGTALTARLRALGHRVLGMDLRAPVRALQGDVRDVEQLQRAILDCDGVVHLAAVSRVVWAERDHVLCWETNVGAFQGLLRLALSARPRPWVVFVSSREAYGQPALLPATEDTPLSPVNIYGCSKVAGERLCMDAAAAGLRAAIVRLSNVFGSANDHVDRVVPAFIRASLAGAPLRVEGAANTFDFTYIDDAVSGLVAVVNLLRGQREALPPLHLVTGVPTTLDELASRVLRLSGSDAPIVPAEARSFDVGRFYGDPARAASVLGWRAEVPLDVGLARLIDDVRELERRVAVT